MNYCTKCGAPLTPGKKFCTKCGAPVENKINPQPVPRPAIHVDKRIVIGGVVAACAVVGIVVGINVASHSYNLSDYCTVDYTGYENYGTAEPDLSYDKLYKKLRKHVGNGQKAGIAETFVMSIDPEVDSSKQGTLSNGDSVKIAINYDANAAKELGLHISGTDNTVTVSGLKKANVTDPFKSLKVSITGALPYLIPQVDSDGDFYVKNDDDDSDTVLSKEGDEFTVAFNGENDTDSGVVYARTQKKYKVGKASTYISDPSKLTSEDKSQIQGFSKKFLKDNGCTYDNLKFVGCYAQLEKSDSYSYGDTPELLYAIYSYDEEDDDSYEVQTEYLVVQVSGAMKQPDGSLWFDTNSAVYNDGYSDPSQIYSDVYSEYYDIKADSSLEQ
ncbi:MAG: zinc ribbon domain-containing protein [Lachnospiraceae bacterium]|nr:zinc ribbon domain-containing protein [Lachnospiraceae bacterium]